MKWVRVKADEMRRFGNNYAILDGIGTTVILVANDDPRPAFAPYKFTIRDRFALWKTIWYGRYWLWRYKDKLQPITEANHLHPTELCK